MGEIWALVDKNEKETGVLIERGTHTPIPQGMYHTAVDVWVRNMEGKLLLTQRHPDKKPWGNLWECSGGCLVKGESKTNGARRELMEETGIELSEGAFSYLGKNFVEEEQCIIYTYAVCPPDDIELTLQAEEVVDSKWVTPAELEAMKAQLVPGLWERWMQYKEELTLDLTGGKAPFALDQALRTRKHENAKKAFWESLGQPEYLDMFRFVEDQLHDTDTENIGNKIEINYSRSGHTYHVLNWAKKLYDASEAQKELHYEDIMIATIFHDVGRQDKLCQIMNHAEAGVPITRKYLKEHGYPEAQIDHICYLVGSHSYKNWMEDPSIDKDLLVLMEADLLDDMGALGIVMDAMIAEKRNPDASFEDCLDHMSRYTLRIQQENPMKSAAGRKIWEEKTRLTEKFIESLEEDLGL